MKNSLVVLFVAVASLTAHGESADYTYVPPTAKAARQPAGPVSASALASMLKEDYPRFSIDTYAGQTKALKQKNTRTNLQVAVGALLDWSDTVIFDQPTRTGATYHWRTSIQSVDATALRLRVDLNGLRPDDTVWVVDTLTNRTFGPYTLADANSEGRWLPTTMGDNAVLWVCTADASAPDVTVRALSHYYESLTTKQSNPCPIPADCITNTALTEISSGIGRLTVTNEQGSSGLCSGALINNANTTDLESYFLTADHCFQNFGAILASDLEVIWDFRATGCGGAEPSTATLSQLPRSAGSAFLGNSKTLDGMLLKLATVPVGTRGRAYLGWDTRTPVLAENVVCLHHPAGEAMKESIGTVKTLDVDTIFGQNQTTLRWSEGITEGGSSGSPSMFDDGNFRIFGILSNGNDQSCDPERSGEERVDQYSSFREFFNQIGGFLVDATPPSAGTASYAGGDTGGNTLTGCLQNGTKSPASVGDLLVAGLALMTLAAWSSFRTRP